MTGDASKFTHISPKKSGHVTYGDNNKGRILGVGKIATNSSTSIENVLLVDGLKHNLQIKQTKNGIFINQSKYCKDLIHKFGMENAKHMATPMSTACYLDKDETGQSIHIKKYRGMIESFLYLSASGPDIMFSVCMCARFQANPKESHLSAVKRIMRYLLSTINLGLWYPKNFTCNLIGYSNSDFSGCKIDRKSTNGTCHFIGSALVSWHSKKQNSVALSTAEAEYISTGSCCAQIL